MSRKNPSPAWVEAVVTSALANPPARGVAWSLPLLVKRTGYALPLIEAAIVAAAAAGSAEAAVLLPDSVAHPEAPRDAAEAPPASIQAGSTSASPSQAKAGDEATAQEAAVVEPVSRPAAGRSAAATAETMAVTAGETAAAAETVPSAAAIVDRSLTRDEAVELLREIEAYCARTSVAWSDFGVLALDPPFPGFVGLLRRRLTVRSPKAAAAREFMARHPDGATRGQIADDRERSSVAPSVPVLADIVAAEAMEATARRRVARAGGTRATPISPIRERIEAAFLETADDGISFLRRKWPSLLTRLLAAARDDATAPGPMLARIVDLGLDQIEADLLTPTAAAVRRGAVQ